VKGYKLLQVFLSTKTTSHPGIFEVSTNSNDDLHCTCPGFTSRGLCKHIDFVKAKMNENKGVYPLAVSSKATSYDAEAAKTSEKAMRDFVIRFGKIEVF